MMAIVDLLLLTCMLKRGYSTNQKSLIITEGYKDHLSQRTTLHAWAYVFIITPPPFLPLSSKYLKHLEYLYFNFYINPLLIKVPLLFNIYYTFKLILLKYLISQELRVGNRELSRKLILRVSYGAFIKGYKNDSS
jgi:hypothetical protein